MLVKFNKNFFLEIINVFLISLLYIFPFFIAKLGYVKIFFIVLISIFSYSIVRKLIQPFVMIFLVGLFLSLLLAYHDNNNLFTSLGSSFCFIELFFLPIVLMLGIYKLDNKKIINVLFYGILIIILIPFISSYNAFAFDNSLSRTLTAINYLEEGQLQENLLKNIGSINFVYSIGVIFLLFFYDFLNSKKKINKIIVFIILVFCIIFFFNAGYSILFINLFISTFLIYLFHNIKDYLKAFILFICIFIFILFLKNILMELNTIIDNPIFNLKLNILINTVDGQETTSDNIGRVNLYNNAFLIFLSSPIFGCMDSLTLLYCHSTVINFLARTGIIGFSFYVYLYYYNFKLLLFFISKNTFFKLFIPIIVFVLLCALLNPIDTAIQFGLLVFLLLPLYVLREKFFRREND